MTYEEGKDQFIEKWGVLGSSWGINKTMAQIHALLMISPDPITSDDIMGALKISRGNTSMNIRALMDWGIVFKKSVPGDRKEYYITSKDPWELAIQVAKERRRRELTPVRELLQKLQQIETKEDSSAEEKQFKTMTKALYDFANQADGMAEFLLKKEKNWFYSTFIKLFK